MTPKNLIYSNDVEMVIVEGIDGKEGFMAGHLPIIKFLKKGTVEVKECDTETKKRIRVMDGFLSVQKDMLIYTSDAVFQE